MAPARVARASRTLGTNGPAGEPPMARLATSPSISPAPRRVDKAAPESVPAPTPPAHQPSPHKEALARALPLLACPICAGDLALEPAHLRCRGCKAAFARDRVVRFVDRAAYAE